VRRLLAAVLPMLSLLAVAAGCGGSSGAKSATNVDTVAASDTPAGFTVRKVRGQGFSIAVPKDWRSIDASSALRGNSVKQFEKENPAAAGAVEVLSRPNSPMKFVAVDPSATDFATNVNVLVSRIPGTASFSTWTKAEAAQIEALHPTHLTQGPVQLKPGKGYKLAYHAQLTIRGNPRVLAIHQYMVKRGGFLYVITYTTSAKEEAKRDATFEDSAHTFDLKT
jgi:hypothetical protein